MLRVSSYTFYRCNSLQRASKTARSLTSTGRERMEVRALCCQPKRLCCAIPSEIRHRGSAGTSPRLPPPLPSLQVAYRYVKQRRQFGRQPHFTDQGAEVRCFGLSACACQVASGYTVQQQSVPPAVCLGFQLLLDLRPNEEHAKAWIVKQHATATVQAAPEISEHEVGAGYEKHRVACMSGCSGAKRASVPLYAHLHHQCKSANRLPCPGTT